MEQLANGMDHTTGESFPQDSHYSDPEVIRALYTVLNAVRIPAKDLAKTLDQRQGDNIEQGKPRNAGLPWSDSLRSELAVLFSHGQMITELANHFERTKGAIKAELKH